VKEKNIFEIRFPKLQIRFYFENKELTTFCNGVYKEKDKITWFKTGFIHRDTDLPAVKWNNGDTLWFKNGKRHRENNLPAVITKTGNKSWYLNGKLHRENDYACKNLYSGKKEWYLNGDCIYRDTVYGEKTKPIPNNATKEFKQSIIKYKLESM
jgi:antitoxin component YwqK of YwqJK toxin-antitoxin module